ncbi:unnamed protein product [Didymodactylos carnosus]|uniref:V(D)J recombination-activating protein 1 RNase H domain-containing protein n=1 Tax=Didymodactylos carnosus TaxID=1234261 RepID=A0A816DR57_9BILA|nr:unnamed protein product [Didymodactylos carnosus]CAF1636527.1 unnamed protein product [Didymodactylos carnosus]CAF4468523.1 unnamed protein product [Didymodactylos carnosus]CAF4541919.1 unnamed protein product [Didymodactylos carnosus]
MIVPLALSDGISKTVVWCNETPNSSFCTRLLLIVVEKESPELVKYVNEVFEPQDKHLQESGMDLSVNGKTYHINIITIDSMKDLKVCSAESGLGGAHCLMCHALPSEWHDRDKLLDSDYFRISRSTADTLESYKSLVEADGIIKKKRIQSDETRESIIERK